MFRSKTKLNLNKKNYMSFLLSFFFILSFILILFNKADYFLINKIKGASLDYAAPLTYIISSPVEVINNIAIKINSIQNLQIKNLKLKEEVLRLKKWQTLAIKNSRENRVLKKLLNSTSHNIDVIKTASVINQSQNLYSKIITINAGLNFKVKKNLAVINEKGLVGKTVFSSNVNSRVLMINDPSSSIPVKTLAGGALSILKGTNSGKLLKSAFIKDTELPKIGDLLVTSGNAKIFPRDILVARVVKVKDDYYFALPYVDFKNLNYVQIIKSK